MRALEINERRETDDERGAEADIVKKGADFRPVGTVPQRIWRQRHAGPLTGRLSMLSFRARCPQSEITTMS